LSRAVIRGLNQGEPGGQICKFFGGHRQHIRGQVHPPEAGLGKPAPQLPEVPAGAAAHLEDGAGLKRAATHCTRASRPNRKLQRVRS
jgi:hypothetical protein